MSDSTPPPCCVGSQNHALCGPACSSPTRTKRERAHRGGRHRPSCARACWSIFMWIWFSKYAVGAPISRASSTTRRASARLRASGFSQIRPRSRAPSRTAAAISSITSTRQKFGLKIATTSTCGTISRTLSNTRASPSPRLAPTRASSCGGVRDVMPGDLDPADLSSARRWNCADEPGADDAVAQRLHAWLRALSRRTCSSGRPTGSGAARSHVVSRSTRRPSSAAASAPVISSSTCSASAPDARCGRPVRCAHSMSARPMPRCCGQVRLGAARSRSTPRRRGA